MASDAIGRVPGEEKGVATSSAPDAQRDVEEGLEMVDIDRIEKVYA